jgi:ABC-type glutathione transport system ATPase component
LAIKRKVTGGNTNSNTRNAREVGSNVSGNQNANSGDGGRGRSGSGGNVMSSPLLDNQAANPSSQQPRSQSDGAILNNTSGNNAAGNNNINTPPPLTEEQLRTARNSPLALLNIRKEFGNELMNSLKVAVNDVSFHVNVGEIFALLGHNGAGKTTLINMLTGMTGVTSGDGMVMGYSILDDLYEVRRRISVCPQDNPIWSEYSVRQHLRFFAAARGMEEGDIDKTVEKYVKILGLEEKIDWNCGKLSGGQKRR